MTGERATVFLVDDDPDFLEINGCLLEDAGYRVVRCSGPDDALRRMDDAPPDLVVSDLMMDRLDAGFSFARRLKQDPARRGVRVLIVTAAASALGFDLAPRSPADLAAMHADGWLEKPVDGPRLLAAVRRVLAEAGKEAP
jgi:CheY-like chemotaxis protein